MNPIEQINQYIGDQIKILQNRDGTNRKLEFKLIPSFLGQILVKFTFVVWAMGSVGCYNGSGLILEDSAVAVDSGLDTGLTDGAPGNESVQNSSEVPMNVQDDELTQECLEWIENNFFIFYDNLPVDSLAPDNTIIGVTVNELDIEPSDELFLNGIWGNVDSRRSEFLYEASHMEGDYNFISRHMGQIHHVKGDLTLNTLKLESLSRIEGNARLVLHEIDILSKYAGNVCLNAQKVEYIQDVVGHMTILGRSQGGRQAVVTSIKRFSGVLEVINADLNIIKESRSCNIRVSQGDIGSIAGVAGKLVLQGGDILGGITGFEGELHLNGGTIFGGLKDVAGKIYLEGGSISGDLINVSAEIIP